MTDPSKYCVIFVLHNFVQGSREQEDTDTNVTYLTYLSHAVQETLHFHDPLVPLCNLGFCDFDVSLRFLQSSDVLIELGLCKQKYVCHSSLSLGLPHCQEFLELFNL